MNSQRPASNRFAFPRASIKRHRAAVCLAAAGAASLIGASAARANDWNGANSTDWFDALNWTNPQAVPNAGNIANLLAAYTNAPTIDGASAAVRGLTIDNALSQYTVSGTSTISIGSAGITVTNGGTTNFSPVINVVAPQTWTIGSDSKLVLNHTAVGANPSAVQGVGTITIDGGGTVELQSGENTFAGGFVVNKGTLTNTSFDQGIARAFRSNRITLGADGIFALTNASLGTGLDTGEISGSGTFDTLASSLFLFALNDATFSGTMKIGSTGGGITVRGIATQTFSGDTSALKGPPAVTEGATMVLTGDAALLDASTNTYFARGGHLVLDNSQNNLPNRFNPAANVDGRGSTDNVVQLIGNATATASQTFNNLTLNNGALKLKILHTAGSNAATFFNFTGNLNRAGTQAVVDFSATGGVVGGADNGPRFMFPATGTGTNGVSLLNGVIATGTGAASSVGFATVNNFTDFASYSTARGVIAASTTAFPGSSDATVNALVTSSVTTGGAASAFSLNTLKIQPSAPGQTLDVNGAGALTTGAILLVGPNSFTISSTGGGKVVSPSGNTRYYTVSDSSATLTISADTASTGPITKAGPGTLFLSGTNTFDTVSGTSGININLLDGVLRATAASLPNSKTVLRFRGGVFELVGGGLINRQVNNSNAGTNGAVNWFGGNTNDQGSGGFSAFGGSAVVDLDILGSAETYAWGSSPSFVSAGYSIVFGSRTADSLVEFRDNISLSGTSNSANFDRFYNLREIRVVDNPAVTTDSARMTGAITSNSATNGGQNADFMKTGDGTLELANANNNYLGNTIVAGGTLLVSGKVTDSPNYLLKGGQLTVTGSIAPGANMVLTGGSASFSSARVNLGAISATAGTLSVTPGASANTKVLTANSVSLSGTGKIDLNNNAMVIDYATGGPTPIAAVRAALLAGRIASTSATTDGSTAIGYAEASDYAASNRASLLNAGPITIDDSSIILKYTKAGDATLDGSVNFADLVQLAQNYNIADGNRVWGQGDFTYDGTVNFADLVLLAQNYNTSLPSEPIPGASASFQADFAAAFASVPEPGALSILALSACGLAGRRRRRSNAR